MKPIFPLPVILSVMLICMTASTTNSSAEEKRPYVKIRGVYGGLPMELLEKGPLKEQGINAIFMSSNSLNEKNVGLLKKQGVKIFAEFNTMHVGNYLKEHPDAAPVGADGKVCPPPHDWQGICPTHPGYRKERMEAFRKTLRDHEIDGIWLDYHHSHASWERDVPAMPDTCFCERCLSRFSKENGIDLPDENTSRISQYLLSEQKEKWVQWRCDVFTDWVREFDSIIEETRPNALFGTFHCPWSKTDYDGALRNKLAIDLKAQSKYIDVFSIMPYHARFGHADDPSWISRQTAWLGNHLGIKGEPGERHQIWPIVQISDWGESVPVEQVQTVLDHGTRRPATGVMIFHWGALKKQSDKAEAMTKYYQSIKPE